MPIALRNGVAGRTSLAALTFAAATLLAGCLFLIRKAEAQQFTVNTKPPVVFAPVHVTTFPHSNLPSTISASFVINEAAFVNGYIQGFRMRISTMDANMVVDIQPPAGENQGTYVIQESHSGITGQQFISVTGPNSFADSRVTTDDHVVIRILPATLTDGKEVEPLAAGLTISGSNDSADASGNPVKIPFTYFQGPMDQN